MCRMSGCETLRSFFFFSSRRRHTRSLRDWSSDVCSSDLRSAPASGATARTGAGGPGWPAARRCCARPVGGRTARSEEHTSELQSRRDLVCRLLLEKKNKKKNNQHGKHTS